MTVVIVIAAVRCLYIIQECNQNDWAYFLKCFCLRNKIFSNMRVRIVFCIQWYFVIHSGYIRSSIHSHITIFGQSQTLAFHFDCLKQTLHFLYFSSSWIILWKNVVTLKERLVCYSILTECPEQTHLWNSVSPTFSNWLFFLSSSFLS